MFIFCTALALTDDKVFWFLPFMIVEPRNKSHNKSQGWVSFMSCQPCKSERKHAIDFKF